MVRTLIFDCDGVLADTERCGHLPAFNQTFKEFDLPVCWSEDDYGQKLKTGGGKERLANLFTPEFVERAGLPSDADSRQELIAALHKRKTAIYVDLVMNGQIPGRPGIARIVDAALSEGWTLAVASTSAQESVEAVLKHVVGASQAAQFAAVLAGDIVAKKKPAPDIYHLALERTGADPDATLIIEDSRNGLSAAAGAGLPCLVTVNDYTATENFDESVLVVTSLGDPEGPSTQVLANRVNRELGDWVTLGDLEGCMRR